MFNNSISSTQSTNKNQGPDQSSFQDHQSSPVAPAHKAIQSAAVKLFTKGGAALRKALCCPLSSKSTLEFDSIKKESLAGYLRVSDVLAEIEQIRAEGTTALKAKSSQFHLRHFRPNHPSDLYSGQLNTPVPYLAKNINVDVQETQPFCLGHAVYSCALQANYKKITEVSREKFVHFLYENVDYKSRKVAGFLTHSLGCPIELVENNRGFASHSENLIALLEEGPVMASFVGHPENPWTPNQFSNIGGDQSRSIAHAVAIVGFSSHEKSFIVADSNHTKPTLIHRDILNIHISYPLISFRREPVEAKT